MDKRLLALILLLFSVQTWAQNTASFKGKVIDKKDQSELIGVTILIKGTSFGTSTDNEGKFLIKGIKPGEYTIEISYIGYKKIINTGLKLKAGEVKDLGTFQMQESTANIDEVVVLGKKPLIDIEKGQSINSITQENIELAPARQLQKIINTQPGVIQSPAGVSIRGSRTYETGTYIDGVSVTDPLAGTGFGLDIGANAIGEIEITTGGIGAEIGDATAGVVSAKTKTAGNKFELGVNYKRDNFGFNKDYTSSWNSQLLELNIGSPLFKEKLGGRLKVNVALRAAFTDEFYKNPANKVSSSLLNEHNLTSPNWTPFQDNRWSSFLKLSYNFKKGKILTGTWLRSITVNQDVNMLRIFGNDAPYQPGFQYNFSQQMDNANSFTHESNMQMINFKHSINKRLSYNATVSRLLVQLRADANGRPWRPLNVDQIFDASSINQYPTGIFEPTANDSAVYVNSPSGFNNNNGIASLWHHHYLEEYVAKATGNYFSKNSLNKLTFGFELKFQEMLWIDIVRPWIGAPIQLADGTYSQTFRLGQQSDIWQVSPRRGGFFVSDQIKYKGLIASLGGRFEYWAPGKYVDDAVADSRAPILDEVRQDYLDNTVKIGGLRYKFRFLPKINATFPIAENKMLFFNYGHTTILPHPSFIYPGLNPYYQDRSTLSRVGNPNLNPEVDISYELGMKFQITSNDALSFSAFFKDKYDFVTTTSIIIKDVTGREVSRTMRINSDYARTRGIELNYIKRIKNWYQGQASFTYMVSTGQSASANEALKDILATGNVEDTKEYYLPWDVPFDLKTNHVFKIDKKGGLFDLPWLNNMSFYFETVYRSGVRYTPYIFDRNDPNTGRPIYVVDPNPDARWSKRGTSWFWADFTFTKYWKIKGTTLGFNIQISNIFNNKNAAIINPVTGKAYNLGDNVPDSWVDPRYVDPRLGNNGPPPSNPARYLEQRHTMVGLSFKF
ncbi:MAG: TonB-dependent receptor [Bacteroidia bacterium]|nr:TonB-dependent receptor [Bacteroidia bacterium]MCF8426804.1 TonB-dependent receptor [Bacteroidia bacterium]MCF8446742.1 TonB-dependent receptor [Bacteroidia bacterium]